jgi:RNA polymerase sigma-70 factor (ECF subfamily)
VTTILQRVAGGDRAAVQECIDRYGSLVHTLARRMCPAGAEVDDAVQEAFIDLWRKADHFDPRIAEETTFVAMVARRRLIDMGRRLQRHAGAAEVDESLAAESGDVGLEAELADEVARAKRAFKELKPEQQRVLRLSVWDGHSHQSIADLTGLPLGTVKTHARRGLSRLREMLSPEPLSSTEGLPS